MNISKSILLFLSIFVSITVAAESANTSWTFTRDALTQTRGGTSQGIPVTFDNQVPEVWKDLKQAGLSKFEKDRKAILALQGEFKTKFEFLETFATDVKSALDKPYVSWATEYVKVIEERTDFISLQHMMVMFYKNKKTGKVTGPLVMKHWRQDWTWQPKQMWQFKGDNTWQTSAVLDQNSHGKWLWEVFQVDDSPRYAGLGKWNHMKNLSEFSTERMSRPLPRREHSVRNDYKILMGLETLVVTPQRWFHEQKNYKHKTLPTNEFGTLRSEVVGREIGHNSYTRIKNFDFSQGYLDWEKQKDYWQDVRKVWSHMFSHHPKIKLKKAVEGKPLYLYHFEQAADDSVIRKSPEARYELIKKTIHQFMVK